MLVSMSHYVTWRLAMCKGQSAPQTHTYDCILFIGATIWLPSVEFITEFEIQSTVDPISDALHSYVLLPSHPHSMWKYHINLYFYFVSQKTRSGSDGGGTYRKRPVWLLPALWNTFNQMMSLSFLKCTLAISIEWNDTFRTMNHGPKTFI